MYRKAAVAHVRANFALRWRGARCSTKAVVVDIGWQAFGHKKPRSGVFSRFERPPILKPPALPGDTYSSRYFELDDDYEVIPFEKLVSSRAQTKGIRNAHSFMTAPTAGTMPKRISNFSIPDERGPPQGRRRKFNPDQCSFVGLDEYALPSIVARRTKIDLSKQA